MGVGVRSFVRHTRPSHEFRILHTHTHSLSLAVRMRVCVLRSSNTGHNVKMWPQHNATQKNTEEHDIAQPNIAQHVVTRHNTTYRFPTSNASVKSERRGRGIWTSRARTIGERWGSERGRPSTPSVNFFFFCLKISYHILCAWKHFSVL